MIRQSILALICASLPLFETSAQDCNVTYADRPFLDQCTYRIYEVVVFSGIIDHGNGYVDYVNFSHTYSHAPGNIETAYGTECTPMLEHTLVHGPNAYAPDGSLLEWPEESGMIFCQEGNVIYCDTFGPDRVNAGKLCPIMDFSLSVGDSFLVYDIDTDQYSNDLRYHILADEFISVKGQVFRRLTIGDSNGEICDYWVEGIGSKNSCYMSMSLSSPSTGFSYSSPSLLGVYQDGNLIFENSDFETLEIVKDNLPSNASEM